MLSSNANKKNKGFSSPTYVLFVLAQQSQHHQTWVLYSFSPVNRVVLPILFAEPSAVCADALAIAQPRQCEGLERPWVGRLDSYNYCLLSELDIRFSANLENSRIMNWKYFTWKSWGLTIFRKSSPQSSWEHQSCHDLWLYCHHL